MKKNEKQCGKGCKILLLSAVALLMCVVAQAQNSVADYKGITGKDLTTIVREYTSEKFVVYAAGNTKSFCLVEMTGAAVFDAPLPSGITVNDFEIFDQKVYFCGDDNATPIIGWFDVDSLFTGLSSIGYVEVPSSLPCPDPYGTTDIISKLIRITPTKFWGNVHLLLTGEATCDASTSLNHCLVDIYHNGTGWVMAYHQQNTGIYFYDDIEVTPTNIVIVGHKEASNAEYIQEYSMPAAANQNIFAAQAPQNSSCFSQFIYAYGCPVYIPDSHKDILVDWIDSTMFATVAYGSRFVYPINDTGTFLNIYKSVGVPAGRWFIQEHCGGNRELRYNHQTNSIMLLFDSCSSTWSDGYIEFYLDNTHTNVTNVEFHKENSKGRYSSLDVCPNSIVHGKTVLTGRSPAYNLRIWQHINKPDAKCSKDIPLDTVQVFCDYQERLHDFCFAEHPLKPKYLALPVMQERLKILCKEEDE